MTDCGHSEIESQFCRMIEEAIDDQHVVTFKYKKADGSMSSRTLSPYEVTGDIIYSNLKVLGWDHERQALRSFKINWDQMSKVRVTLDVDYRVPEEQE